jgi:predicted O-methyltransferase YrrM
MKINNRVANNIGKLPFFGRYIKDYLLFKMNSRSPAGHFYSPIPSLEDIKNRENEIWKEITEMNLKGINLNTSEQMNLLNSFKPYYDELPFTSEKQNNLRYYYKNNYYSYSDGIILHCMIRHFKPKRIIEIGSGLSSAVMLDTNNLFFDDKINLTFIDPYPENLYFHMNTRDKEDSEVIIKNIQEVPLFIFEKLQANDILFVDSSHVVKTGGDVNHILFEILPLLKPGVIIHFHDIFYPFEYPKNYIFERRNWNEIYFLRAFLMQNDNYKILFFSDYMHKFNSHIFSELPLCKKNTGGNLWILKIS